jgi:uncharacterized protein with PQ loop repeat
MSGLQVLGICGSLLLALSGLPQAVKSAIDGRTGDISKALLWMWVVGAPLMLVYTMLTAPTLPLILNFGINTGVSATITWYYYFPRSVPAAPKPKRKSPLSVRRNKARKPWPIQRKARKVADPGPL